MANQGGQQRLTEQLTVNMPQHPSGSAALSINQQQRRRQGLNDINKSASASSSPVTQHLANNHSANNQHHYHHAHHPTHFKSHQRRQSVARLLPDISKLRLLSWLVEASSELIQCDIAIMDGVYAKLNKSQESLLFWTASQQAPSHSSTQHMSLPAQIHFRPQQAASTSGNNTGSGRRQRQQQSKQPALPSVLPVASNSLVVKVAKQCQKPTSHHHHRLTKGQTSGTRSHHSLPITNYDSSSLAAISMSPSLNVRPSTVSGNVNGSVGLDQLTVCSTSASVTDGSLRTTQGKASTMPPSVEQQQSITDSNNVNSININNNESFCDSNQSDDDDNSSAASSTTSSGIHGGGTSFSSASSSASSGSSAASSASTTSSEITNNNIRGGFSTPEQSIRPCNSAEVLSEKIRRTVMEHTYLQNLLVNVIRQHDRQRDIINQQRRRQMSLDQQLHRQRLHQQRVDLVDIAEALDDGCLCLCHSQPRDDSTMVEINELNSNQLNDSITSTTTTTTTTTTTDKASTLPASGSKLSLSNTSSNQPSVPSRKVRRLKKLKGGTNNEAQFTRQDMINQLSDRLCENCFETHYWLRSCSQIESMKKSKLDLTSSTTTLLSPNKQQHLSTSLGSSTTLAQQVQSQNQEQDLSAIIIKRNATFIKLVQQEVRSTISKSIELIDLIRKEIKSPESIKQKHLMKCFSSSIQLLTSVGNYVVPAQDISTFIPEFGQQQATLFRLPPSDFDHLLHYPPPPPPPPPHILNQQHQSAARKNTSANNNNSNPHYHLASAPDIPIRRRFNQLQIKLQQQNKLLSDSNGSLPTASQDLEDTKTHDSNTQFLSSNLQRLRTSDNLTTVVDSSSGASSNNSSASSSIARGGVQQSSLTRAQTSSAILDGKTSHDLSLEAIANLSAAAGTGRQHADDEDSMFFQSRPKFWQSSKFNFIKKLLHVKQQRLLRQQSKDRRIYNNKVQNKFRLVMMDLTHFNKSQQLLTTENGVNSLLTSMRNVLEFGLYLTLKLY